MVEFDPENKHLYNATVARRLLQLHTLEDVQYNVEKDAIAADVRRLSEAVHFPQQSTHSNFTGGQREFCDLALLNSDSSAVARLCRRRKI